MLPDDSHLVKCSNRIGNDVGVRSALSVAGYSICIPTHDIFLDIYFLICPYVSVQG